VSKNPKTNKKTTKENYNKRTLWGRIVINEAAAAACTLQLVA
jgi:hypothetical protein